MIKSKNTTAWPTSGRVLTLALLLLFCSTAGAQILKPVKWQYASKKISDTEAVVLFRAMIDEGWHIYSQHVPEGGPEKTVIQLRPSKAYQPIGKVMEPEPKVKYEDVFDMDVPYFDGAVVFQQKVRLNEPTATVRGTIRFMVCDESRCLPAEDIEFAVKIE